MVSDSTVQPEPTTKTAYEEIPIIIIVDGFAQRRLPNGDLHSPDNDTPALIDAFGAFYYRNGMLHRDNNLPSAICAIARVLEYHVHGVLHNVHGPAVRYANGDCEYYVNGLRHNAIEDANGAFRQQPAVIRADGTRIYYVRNEVHRADGLPAAIFANGGIEFREHGILHCLNGPAMTFANGDAEFLQYGKRHRLDGPAMIFADPNVEDQYYLEGVRVSPDGHAKLIREPWIYFSD
jgi:hypothetical protein